MGKHSLSMLQSIVCLLLTVRPAAGETLQEAWLIATAEDLTIEAAEFRVAAAESDLAAARGSRWPTLVASASATQFNETPAFDFSGAGLPGQLPLFGGSSQLMADARVTLPLFTSGMISNSVQAAKSSVQVQRLRSQAHAQDVRLKVAENFIGVLRASSALRVAESLVSSLTRHVADINDMFATGAVAKNDLLAAQVSLAAAKQRQLQARNNVDLTKAMYNKGLGRRLADPVNLDDKLPGLDSRLVPESLQVLTETAFSNRSELDGLRSAAEATGARAQSTRAKSRPQLSLVGGYTALENSFLNRQDFWSIGFGVQWAVFDANRSRDKASALSMQSSALYREYRDLQSVVELQVHSAWLQMNETVARIKLAEGAIEQANENLRVVRDRYRNGEGTNTEVLDAEGLRTVSRSNYDNARYDAAYARYRLARAVGVL
ncbi:MAG: TolC family protein [Gammaproteobacteria bacterium]|nr:TolC family protein [Gammaproteobacteria bacterium]